MTRTEQLSRAIAMAKEPEPTFKSVGYLGCLSMLGWYVWDRWAWTPRSITEPEIALKLLKEMRQSLLCSDWPGCEGWRVDIGVEYFGGPLKGPTRDEPELAIAEAYVRAFGIEVV